VRIEAEFEATPEAPGEARALVRRQTIDLVPATTLADVLTVVTELVDNGVRHGEGSGVGLRLDVSSDTVAGEVESAGFAEIEYVAPQAQDPRGLGLHIVNAIAHDWEVEHGEDAVNVVKFEVEFA
jgi:anti-sigma regulatory factor (Ser/Thr protein kinase)